MSMRKHPGRSRALRPSAEGLEGRRLMAGSVSGINSAGDQWTLRLLGRGTIQVIKQDDGSGAPAALDSATEIRAIRLAGTDPNNSRLIGTVTPAAGSAGRVFFQELTQQSNRSEVTGGGLGVLSINIPDFYLGVTDPTSTGAAQPRAQISIPDGINSLRFGGVDATAFFGTDATQAPGGNNTDDTLLIQLGLPTQIGTSIVVDRVTSGAQAGVTSSTGTAGSPTQDRVIFNVAGRINLFQANEVDGNTQFAPAAAGFNAGTIVSSQTDQNTGITGNIGFVRVGGDATNFSVATNDHLSNLYVGGEANNVSVLAPAGARNLSFGKGLDTTTILAGPIETLTANRGALNSRVVSDRRIANFVSGGDVVNSTFLAGYNQGLVGIASTVAQNLTSSQIAQAVTIPTPQAQSGGAITTSIAGDVRNSVFAASDQPISQVIDPDVQVFGNAQDALLPGRITARVEGAISNPDATPDSPNAAFFARNLKLTKGPVAPPNVVEPPLPPPGTPTSLPGIARVFRGTSSTATATATAAARKAGTPRGPARK